MLGVELLAVGRLKEDYLKAACAEYSKRLSAYCRLNIAEINESRLSAQPSAAEIEKALKEEGTEISRRISAGYTIAMCIEGKQLSSGGFASLIEKLPLSGKSGLNIIIGSSYGLSEEIKKNADLCLSMSEMTFPHQLARVMVLEQLYRAFMINSGHKYHK